MVLAASGLHRADRAEVISELLGTDVMLPAPAQGALAIECRTEDLAPGGPRAWLAEALAAHDDAPTRAAVTAERALLRALEAGCSAPVAAYATVDGSQLELRALAITPDGSQVIEGSREGSFDAAGELGNALAQDLLDQGARDLLDQAAEAPNQV